MRIRPFCLGALELRDHILVVQDRPGDQMRKVCDEQRIMRQPVMRDLAAIGVDQECDLGEGVERNSDRKQDLDHVVGCKDRIVIGGEKTGIFEDAEHHKIARDPKRQDRQSQDGAQAPGDQQPANEVIERNRRQQ